MLVHFSRCEYRCQPGLHRPGCGDSTPPSRRGKWTERRVTLPLDLAPEASASLLGYTLKQMDGHEGSAPSIPVWKTGVCLSTPMPGEMACQPKPRRLEGSPPSLKLRRAAFARRGAEGEGWNPVLELHQSLRFCKPPPALLGQRDVPRHSRQIICPKARLDFVM